MFLCFLSLFSLLAAANPIWHAKNSRALVQALEKRDTGFNASFPISSQASLITPDSADWASASLRWSTWSAPQFDVVFAPATEQDVVTGLEYLTSINASFLAKGGGHGNSLTLASVQNGVMINMEQFDHVVMNPDKTITFGGGARFGALYEKAYDAGRELTLGSCACVGATGATLGGGHGRLQGKHGLAADAVVKVRMALWNGTVVEASASENADLFWAMRGAGHNFGIVLETTVKTWPQENKGMHYNADMTFTTDSLEGVITTINDLIPGLDAGLALDLFFYTDPSTAEPVIFLNIVYGGPKEKGQAFTKRFASTKPRVKSPITRLVLNETEVSWKDLPYKSANGLINVACIDGFAQNIYTASTAYMDVALTRKVFDDYVAFVKNNPLASNSIVFYEIFGQQAVVNQRDEQSAVGNRNYAKVLNLIEAVYSDDSVAAAGDAWARRWRDEWVKPKYSGYKREYVYQNYAHGDEPLEALYGYEPWRLARLRKLKNQLDPHGFFSAYHSVS
ncbi:FAD binding domain-containing protein [Xylaria digitata]|nr:FAD binding domain-containing protein [Xylaria digitata]